MIKPGIPFIPMEPLPHPKPFDDEKYGFQIKWDGTRIVAHLSGGVELFNRKMKRRTAQYPEVAGTLSDVLGDSDAVLDGEMITLIGGKPSFQQLMRRDWATDPGTINYLASRIPVTYVVFDILYLNGKSLIDLPFSRRYHILKSTLRSSDPVVVTDTFPGRGIALYEIARERGLEGIVAKRLDSVYQIGKKSDKWLKIKNRREVTALVGGFLAEGKSVRSLFLGQLVEGELIYIGRASSGLGAETSRVLYDLLSKSAKESCPFANPPQIERREKPVWVSPSVAVEVEFLDYTDEGYLRHPVIRRVEFGS
ncbi:RNA ligase family protein [Thermosediminibacter oceani]|uniref:DNA ligase (ATP) n=1 Tax=Thermosediminibacter oceani (strain ATCC BAA-1034 / DSM 16646 / JW/IW-1228P) TaxID=555079 RepID=D9S0A7_THEOJ|nr:RNA ligase family protein [Thermosediminibacter oceani]ADL07035.1 ATP dependent DNA ligase [Thermosediminibacter oceani DSM 16646]